MSSAITQKVPLLEPASADADHPARPAAAEEAPPAQGALPFDPLRIVAALVRRAPMILATGLALSILAAIAGSLHFQTEFKAAAQLMRQESSATFRASELGEPFKPRQLSVPTLVSFMKSAAVIQRVADQAQLPARSVASGLVVAPERNTDLISLSFATTRSAPVAVRVLNAFGNEIVRLTRDLQVQEAAVVNRLLKNQLSKAEEDLRAVNSELLAFSRQTGLVNVDKEIDAHLRTLGDIDLKYETMRIDHETLDLKIRALEQELAANNPLNDRLQGARDRLHDLLQRYTEAHPLVEEQKAAVAELETRLKRAGTVSISAPRQGESGLAAGFYADLVNLKTQKKVLATQIEKLKAVRDSVGEKLRDLPDKGLQFARIKARQQSLESSQSLLASRQREAQLYEENALGYYRFYESKPEEVEIAGRGRKLILAGLAGGLIGLLLAAAAVGLIESLDDRIKTVADLKRASRLPLLATLPGLDSMDAVAQANWGFRTWLALQAQLAAGPRRQTICGWVAASRHEGVSTWIELLARAAGRRDEVVLVITNRMPANGVTLPLADALDAPQQVPLKAGQPTWLVAEPGWCWSSEQRRQWMAALECWRSVEDLVLFVELTSAEQPETLRIAETLPQLIWLSGGGLARGRETTTRLKSFQHAGCRFAGAVLNRESRLIPWP